MPATTDSTRGEESSPDPAPVPSQRDRTIFLTSLCVLTVAPLWPLWATRFLPMQDYPQHLFLALAVLAPRANHCDHHHFKR